MVAQASSLSDQDIEDVSAYLAGVAGETVAAGGTENASFDKADTCAACHGKNGIGVSALWPTLAGQHEDYIEQALHKYRDGTRRDPVMSAQANLIAEEDVALACALLREPRRPRNHVARVVVDESPRSNDCA